MSSTRRESLALGTDQLHISSSNDSGDESNNTVPSTPGVVKRAVTRRGNLLPKTKGFARIRAALLEESAPVDTDSRREAETIRQVRDRDGNGSSGPSPNFQPLVPGPENALEDIPEDGAMGLDSQPTNTKTQPIHFGQQASRKSDGTDFWNRVGRDFRTPPPPAFPPRNSSSMSGDVIMDSPAESNIRSESVIPTLEGTGEEVMPSAVSTGPTRKFGKRTRDDDFDIASIKRRAVSPSLSVQNSPVVAQSPRDKEREASTWGQPPKTTRESSTSIGVDAPPRRSNSGGSTSSMASAAANCGARRVGLQSMTDTYDGLMKMSIE